MPRVKRGVIHNKSRRSLWKKVKGFMWGRKSKIKLAKTAAVKAGVYAYRDRRKKKTLKRQLWQIKINAAARNAGSKYSTLINDLKKAHIVIDRKILAELAEHNPDVFAHIVQEVKTA